MPNVQTKECNYCKEEIFWLKDGNSNIPFDAEVSQIAPGKRYADGYDNIKFAPLEGSPVKGFACHFGRCKNYKKK